MESINHFAAAVFGLAILHTFSVKVFQKLAKKYPEGSIGENFFHLMGEVEAVFGIWAAILVIFMATQTSIKEAIHFLEGLNFTEPAFVFVIMTVCATRPVLEMAAAFIGLFAKLLPLSAPHAYYVSCLVVGPVMGSFITEPAAMTVTALILLRKFYSVGLSDRFKYATLGLLFVNISIGGVFTPYAAPPVLMVAQKWNWDLAHMAIHFGSKALVAILISTLLVSSQFKKELSKLQWKKDEKTSKMKIPLWVFALHIVFLAAIIMGAHHMIVFIALFMFFLGVYTVTSEYQEPLKLREALMVGFFLGGLVVLGGPQKWWLEPLITSLNDAALYFGATALTAITDNAALTYLGSQVETLSDSAKYALVAGAVTGGGLTVIANAPNPAGYGILNSSFGRSGISPVRLFLGALVPTIIAAICFWGPTYFSFF